MRVYTRVILAITTVMFIGTSVKDYVSEFKKKNPHQIEVEPLINFVLRQKLKFKN